MSFTIGENVGAYRVIAQLGRGGMATVFKGYHPGLDRYVALKVLHPAFKEDAGFVQRFNREARIVARLEHPNIVPVYDFAEHRGLAYLVMRFIDGETLKARLQRGWLRPGQIAQVAEQMGAALSHAHREGILHRDIKPSNILLTGDPEDPEALGDIFLADFGLARIAAAGESTLSRDMMMGTPQYISPEQAKGTRELDAGTDIYSLGVVLFELVTGRVPFSADTPYSVIHDHIFTPLPMPTSINPDIPEAVERALLKALAKERADRYPDVDSLTAAFVEAMQPAVETPTTVAPIPPSTVVAPSSPSSVEVPQPPVVESSPPLEIERPVKKRKLGWILAGIGALLLLCLCGALFVGKVIESRQEVELPPIDDPVLAERIREVDERVEQNPDDAWAQMDLGFLYLEAGAPDEAEEQLWNAIELRPEDEEIYLEIARRMIDHGRQEIAIEALIIGLDTLPESRRLRVNVARALWEMGNPGNDPEMAEGYAWDLVAAAPDEPLPHVLLARALVSQEQMDEARTEIDVALELAPDVPEAHLVNGIWYRKMGRLVQARREFQLALEAGPEEWLRVEVERELQDAGP